MRLLVLRRVPTTYLSMVSGVGTSSAAVWALPAHVPTSPGRCVRSRTASAGAFHFCQVTNRYRVGLLALFAAPSHPHCIPTSRCWPHLRIVLRAHGSARPLDALFFQQFIPACPPLPDALRVLKVYLAKLVRVEDGFRERRARKSGGEEPKADTPA